MTKFEVVTHDLLTGSTEVDHVWKVAHHHGRKKFAKLVKRVERWAAKAATEDHSTDHVVYVRGV